MLSFIDRGKIALLFFSLVFVMSCEEPVDLDVGNEKQIVVESLFTPSQHFKVFLSESRLVTSPDTEEFIDRVNKSIEEGYIPCQGLVLDKKPYYKYTQPMILQRILARTYPELPL